MRFVSRLVLGVAALVGGMGVTACGGDDSGGQKGAAVDTGEGGPSGSGGSSSGSGGSSAGASCSTSGSGGSGGGTAESGAPANGSVGSPCASSTDCNTGLTCHIDTTDYIAHEQCSASCDSDEQCTSMFGTQTFCIGAHICVQACRDNADCPAKTICTSNRWCERSGPGSGVPTCGGSATPCSILTDSQCSSALGCSSNSGCQGLSTSCYSLFSSFECTSQEGCYWDSTGSTCSGSAESCDLFFGSGSCALQTGCTWHGGCSGSPLPCSELTASLCTQTPGCSLSQ